MTIRIGNVGAFLAYISCILLVGRPAMRWIVKRTPEGRSVNKIYIYAIIVVFLELSYFARNFGEPFLVGAVIFGLAVPEGPPLGSELVSQLELFSKYFLSSIFVTCCTMKVDLTKCNSLSLVLVLSAVIITVHLVRWVLCMGICRYCKIPFKDGFCLALILSSKGVVDICSYLLVYESMVLTCSTSHATSILFKHKNKSHLHYLSSHVSVTKCSNFYVFQNIQKFRLVQV